MDGMTQVLDARRWPARPQWGQVFAAHGRGEDFGTGAIVRLGQSVDNIARHCAGRLVYLATPYSARAVDADGDWCAARAARAEADASLWVGNLWVAGVTAISPVVQGHRAYLEVPDRMDPLRGAWWMQRCWPLMHACEFMVIPEIEGWDRSAGIWAEFGHACASGKPVFVMAHGPGRGVSW